MNATQMIDRLTLIEVASEYATEPDLRHTLMQERFAVASAARSGDGKKIAAAMTEAERVAKMWGVTL